MSNLSYYFTLFKKFQSMGHIAEALYHGSAPGPASINFLDPTALLSMSHGGVALLGTSTSNSPLWMVLNARANLQTAAFEYPTASGVYWTPMPHPFVGGAAAAAWADYGGAPLVTALGNWITAGRPNDFPAFITLPHAGAVPAPLDAGTSTPFVCSYAADDGTVGAVPWDFWDTSLIYLVNQDGTIASPPTLHKASEYFVAAAIGNRGDTAVGRYALNPTSMQTPELHAQAWALTFGTGGASPGVQLPALSNLDPNAVAGLYDVYTLKGGHYDIVGFRLAVADVFNGLVAAINDAIGMGTFVLPMGFSTAESWLTTPPSHVCVKVAVARSDQSWPAYDASPQLERRIGQKNLVVFDGDLSPTAGPSVLNTKTFTVGAPLKSLIMHLHPIDRDLGASVLRVVTDLEPKAAQIAIAVPKLTYARWFEGSKMKGFTAIHRDCRDDFAVPFMDHVVLTLDQRDNEIHLPFLGDHVLPLALLVKYDKQHFKHQSRARVSLEHRARIPVFGKQGPCYKVEDAVIGGFTLETRFHATRHP